MPPEFGTRGSAQHPLEIIRSLRLFRTCPSLRPATLNLDDLDVGLDVSLATPNDRAAEESLRVPEEGVRGPTSVAARSGKTVPSAVDWSCFYLYQLHLR